MSGLDPAAPDGLDLAAERLGGRAVAANDEFFAEKENLLRPARPVFIEDKYTERGKWMDGWETRRRRTPGHDWCVIQLGLPGLVREVVVDTAFFRGNYPESCSIDACSLPDETGGGRFLDGGADAGWIEILPRSPLQGDSVNRFRVDSPWRFTHLRLNIYPDGGVARFRVHGTVIPERRLAEDFEGRVDLAAVGNGGEVIAASDMFFSNRNNMILPGSSLNMGDGWETKRRRGPGNDWAIIRLATEAVLERAIIDTMHYKGNAPGSARLEGIRIAAGDEATLSAPGTAWRPLLEMTPLEPNRAHEFAEELIDMGPLTHVRLSIYPDGGVARLRLQGRPTEAGAEAVALRWLNSLPPAALQHELAKCCAAPGWVRRLVEARPFADRASLVATASALLAGLSKDDLQDAIQRHPRIGESAAAAATTAEEGRWSRGEQAGVSQADAEVQAELRRLNADYEKRFGWIFLVCASGLSAAEIMERLVRRMANDPAAELAAAGDELKKITLLRLEKLIRS